jgi:hypothetical protein
MAAQHTLGTAFSRDLFARAASSIAVIVGIAVVGDVNPVGSADTMFD